MCIRDRRKRFVRWCVHAEVRTDDAACGCGGDGGGERRVPDRFHHWVWKRVQDARGDDGGGGDAAPRVRRRAHAHAHAHAGPNTRATEGRVTEGVGA